MRRFYPEGIIFTCILLVALVTGCGEQDKPKAASPSKEVARDTKDILQERKITTKQKDTISDKSIKPIARQQSKRLPKIILITTSQACHCTLERCSKGEDTVNVLIQQFSEKLNFEKLDYAQEQTLAAELGKKYRFSNLPVLLFFDNEETFKGKLEAFWSKETIKEKLIEIGVE